MPASNTHPSLLSRMRDPADQQAWVEFESRYRGLIQGYARRSGLSAWDAEDLTQTVFLRLTRALPTFQYRAERGRFRHWLGSVVRNAAWEQLARKQPVLLTPDAVEDAPDPADHELEADWEREWVLHHYRLASQSLSRELDPRSLQVFDRLLEGASVTEVARELDLRVEAVHKIKQRTRERLRERIAAQLADEEEQGERNA